MPRRSPPTLPTARWTAAIARIRSDRRRGARALAETTLRALDRELRRWPAVPDRSLARAARAVARSLGATQPAMGVFGRWADEWRALARRGSPRRRAGWVRRWRSRLARESERIAARAARRCPPGARVLTFSRSGTVADVLGGLRGVRRPLAVIALESRPGGEGRAMARDLRRRGVAARCLPDARADEAVAASDLLLLGADTVEDDGAVVHKVGTRALAERARRAGRPVVVVAGRSKFCRRRVRRLPSLFDRTPARLVSAYWTDGPARPKRSNRPRR
ncbi:MAG TPA: hypothetical protein VMG36_03820 [Thermoplasmata archaeon]|nr:hypothetical protein [Thermoplasmata archaeon]